MKIGIKIDHFKDLKIELMDLPFKKDSLAPHMSEETLTYHHSKHHQAYVTKTLSLLTEKENNLLDVIRKAKNTHKVLYNNSAQILNHHIFWLCLQNGITSREHNIIEEHFGSHLTFKNLFVTQGLEQFGSGWVWLLKDSDNKVFIHTSANGDIPEKVLNNEVEILTLCDVWEHAYYIDYRNERKRFLEVFVDHLMKILV